MPSRKKDIRLPPLAKIQAFEASARLGSFEKAGEELCVTASAVGKRIAALEVLIGVSLFARGARGLTLSVAGKEYLGQVRTALGLLSEVSLHKREAQRTERLRICAPPTFSRQILVRHLAYFSALHPGVELELLLSVPFLDMNPPDTDLAIRFGRGAFAGMVAELLIDEPVFPVCAPGYLAKFRNLREPRDLERAVLLRSPLEPWKPWFDAAGLAWPEPSRGTRFADLGMLHESAVNGQGIALARRSLTRSWLDTGMLLRLFAVDARPESSYYLCHSAARPLEGACAAFALWLRGICSKLVP